MVIFIMLIVLIILYKIIKTVKVKLEIENLNIQLTNKGKFFQNDSSIVLLKIFVLNRIKITEIDLKKININDKKFKTRMDKFKQNNSNLNLNIIKFLKESNLIIEKLNLKIDIGTEDIALTVIMVVVISSLLGFILRNQDNNNNIYKINPVYNNNKLNIELDGIFSIRFANIIDIIKVLTKKGRVKKNGRTSNRRTYAYSDG